MSSNNHAATADHGHDTVGPVARKRLWRVFWILLGITVFEVAIAFSPVPHFWLVQIFIALTIVKAYFIVFYFMHMKHETTSLAWTLLLPLILLVYFVFMMMTEGNALNWARAIFDVAI